MPEGSGMTQDASREIADALRRRAYEQLSAAAKGVMACLSAGTVVCTTADAWAAIGSLRFELTGERLPEVRHGRLGAGPAQLRRKPDA
ncbi:MAG: hypothetical protein JWR10_3402 [Rubritepida sp.]|nr:hypothetical protein [Rubritepida sp.]